MRGMGWGDMAVHIETHKNDRKERKASQQHVECILENAKYGSMIKERR